MEDLSEYKALYLQTGREYLQALNTFLLQLEKNPGDKEAISEIFRNAHSLKGQSAAMGYISTGFLCHAIEDVFYEVKEGRLAVTPAISDALFLSFDALTTSLNQIEKEDKEIILMYENAKQNTINLIGECLNAFNMVATLAFGS